MNANTEQDNYRIQEGDLVLLYANGKKWLIKVDREKEFHTHKGFLRLEEIIGKTWGTPIKSSKGDVYFYPMRPLISDLAMMSPRTTNIIYPKDSGYILIKAGIGPNSIVVEAGTGSGALTTILAYYVKPHGHVFTYEIREEFIKKAEKKIKRLGLDKFVTFKNKDICNGIDERNVDAIILDLATPWKVVKHARIALKSDGVFVSYSPTIEQTMKTVKALENKNFIGIETCEILLRDILVREGKTRPASRMIGHTGFITFARNTVKEENKDQEK